MENPFNDAFEKWEKATWKKYFGVPRVPKQDTPQQFESVPVEESFLHQEEQRIEKEMKEQDNKFIDRLIMNTDTNTNGITNFFVKAKQAEINDKEILKKLEG